MTTTEMTAAEASDVMRNGVDTATLFATLDAVKQAPEAVTGDIDLNGILGLDPDVRNGYEKITVRFTIKGDAPAGKLREIVEQSRARSAVYDVITGGVPVTIEVDTP